MGSHGTGPEWPVTGRLDLGSAARAAVVPPRERASGALSESTAPPNNQKPHGAVVRKEDGSPGTRELTPSRVIVGRDGLIRRLRTERVQYWRQHDRDRQIEK
jgi:hypothetical protein